MTEILGFLHFLIVLFGWVLVGLAAFAVFILAVFVTVKTASYANQVGRKRFEDLNKKEGRRNGS